MASKEAWEVFPLGHEDHPVEEWFRLSTVDLLCPNLYNNWALMFSLDDSVDKTAVAELVRHGLEATLSQCRCLIGTFERDNQGNLSILKRRDSSVKLVVQWLDKEQGQSLSYSSLESAHFVASSFGDPERLSIPGMAYLAPGM